VAADRDDNVFVLHRGPQPVLYFDRDGKFLRSWGDEHLKMPHGLRLDDQGNVWVTDIEYHQVLKFTPEGKLLLTLGQKGKPGDTPEQFNKPTDVAVTPSGAFYVSDGYGNSRVLKFSAEGKYLKEWGRKGRGPGEFNLPHAIRVDSRGKIYVADRENQRVQIFDADGKYLAQWDETGSPYGLYLLPDRMLIADGVNNWVKVLDLEGKTLGRFGEKGKAPGQFELPHFLCADSRGNIYVTEITGKRVQKFTK
jgi:DNA-binding beta-propeller fold protein YncE